MKKPSQRTDGIRTAHARQRAIAMKSQFTEPGSAPDDPERQTWKAIRVASAKRRVARLA